MGFEVARGSEGDFESGFEGDFEGDFEGSFECDLDESFGGGFGVILSSESVLESRCGFDSRLYPCFGHHVVRSFACEFVHNSVHRFVRNFVPSFD